MNPQRFDALVRSFAGSRRSALKLALGGVLTAVTHQPTAAAPPTPLPPGRCHGPLARCSHRFACCSGDCVLLESDPHNCGGCGIDCGTGSCCQGTCVDTSSDRNNCGACGAVCTLDLCDEGRCGCGQDYEACNGACVDTSSDMNNCGACGAVCTLDLCDQGRCGCGQGSEPCNGRCVDTSTDPNNCGACGVSCGANSQCVNGACCGLGGRACTADSDCCGVGVCQDGQCACCYPGIAGQCTGPRGVSSAGLCCVLPDTANCCCNDPVTGTGGWAMCCGGTVPCPPCGPTQGEALGGIDHACTNGKAPGGGVNCGACLPTGSPCSPESICCNGQCPVGLTEPICP